MESVICDLETLEAGLVAEAFCHGITGVFKSSAAILTVVTNTKEV